MQAFEPLYQTKQAVLDAVCERLVLDTLSKSLTAAYSTRRNDSAVYALSSEQFKNKLRGARASGLNMQHGFHALLMAALAESVPEAEGGHKNATPFKLIIEALPDAVRGSDVRNWIEAHSNARIVTTKVKGVITHGVKMVAHDHEDYKRVNFDRANMSPFYADIAKKDSAIMLIDDKVFERRLAMLLKHIDTANGDGKLVLSPVNTERLKTLRGITKAA